ncbi:MAG: carbohydrate kinase family protein [Oscillospiraceae bacterium]|nr:carbohydrate kinase family protein [Oscillospiraceae bacterium]
MNQHIYLYGMITKTNGFLLRGDFPKADHYCEVKERYTLPGGETGTAAIVLASLCGTDSKQTKVKLDGNHLGKYTKDLTHEFYNKIAVDVSALHYDPDYDGMDEFVMVDSTTRTNFATFATYFEDYYQRGIIRWNTPNEEHIKGAKVAGIDPFFDKQAILAAELCKKHNIPYVTIDERPGNEVIKHASVVAVSSEYIRDHISDYHTPGSPEAEKEGKIALLKKFAEHTKALVILTGGGGTTYYGRGGDVKEFNAYKVDVVSTLGAGDSFKAGCIYALMQGYDDDKIVRFAGAVAAVACTKFPIGLNPPTMDEVERLMNK